MQTLLLDPDAVEEAAEMSAVVSAVEDAFVADARGDTQMPAKSYVDLPQYNGDFRSMPAYLDAGEWDAAAVKWVNVHPDNPEDHDLPTVMGTVVYSDPETAFPLALLDGTTITRKRTGAAAAVATNHLAVENARTMGIVGAGVQSYTQLEAIATVRPIEAVVVADRDQERVDEFVEAFGDRFEVRGGTIEEAAQCDVLSTVTPVEEPIVDSVGDHTHVNAVGADAAGKHEIDDKILLDSLLVIDDYEQCTHSGEINVPWSEGVLSDEDIHGELGEVIVGEKPGRTPETGVSVFDSTGLAIQDVAASHVVYEYAADRDVGERVSLVDTDVL
ncbi:ornithine cyclodeaminase family protein [Halosimplex rubrum]|uniref:Alanine dehydrogenase n=1 Tax=Halosimplex rubrum TaxID=869889 RepID=A0A7D5T4W4_9EURY|nr:ornithine cyclodeaminase family protein [Halosimplex rubrum]QLH76395.1 ornithine cyclodeaminase family protein [Halosimplex rubrum]